MSGFDKKMCFDSEDKATAEGLRTQLLENHERTEAVWPKGLPHRITVKTHYVYSDGHPLLDLPGRVVVIVRNPKDVLLSCVNYLEMLGADEHADVAGAVDAFIATGGDRKFSRAGYGTWESNWNSWLVQGSINRPVLLVTYEQLSRKPEYVLGQILHFIGIRPVRARIERAVELASFDNLRSLEEEQRATGSMNLGPNRTVRDDRFFFNKGESGRSIKDTFGIDVDDRFDDAFSEATGRFTEIASRGLVQVVGEPVL